MTSRRVFLKGSALAMFGVGSLPTWLSRSVYAADNSARRKKILVAIFQRGAVDGLNVVVPFGEQRYYDLRPSIAIPKADGTAIGWQRVDAVVPQVPQGPHGQVFVGGVEVPIWRSGSDRP